MSDLLTHWAVFDDCRRLARFAGGIEPHFREAIEEQRQHARLGAIVRTERHWMQQLLERARAGWDEPANHPDLDRKLAFALAGMTHAACDRTMKPIRYRAVLADEQGPDPTPNPQREVYAYQDVHVFEHVYLNGDEEPFNRFLLAENGTKPGKTLEEFIRATFLAGLLRLRVLEPDEGDLNHEVLETIKSKAVERVTERKENPRVVMRSLGVCRSSVYGWLEEYRPRDGGANGPAPELFEGWTTSDPDDGVEWVDELLEGVQALYVGVERLVRAYHHPDPQVRERYEIETEFYKADDTAIAAARAIHRGETPDPAEVDEAVAGGTNESGYGQALELGIEYMRRAGAFWRGEIDGFVAENVAGELARSFRTRHGAVGG